MFKVFPATLTPQGKKIPLINDWERKATTDPEQIKLWQEQFRERLSFFGVPCGIENDILALDIDVKSSGYDSLLKNGLIIPDTLSQRTLNGGHHFLFRYPKDGNHYGNKVGFHSGLDTRGVGGWIAWYGIDADFSKPMAEAPQWLLDVYKQKEVSHENVNVSLSSSVSNGIFSDALVAIRDAAPGTRNHTLNTQSYVVGQLVAAGSITRPDAETALTQVARQAGLDEHEIWATVKSGLDGGVKNPMTVALPAEGPPIVKPDPVFTLPGLEVKERWTPRYATLHDLTNRSMLRKPQLFDGWSTEDIAITTADGGTGKTTLKLYEAVCLALGDPFLGFTCKQVGKTLFVTGEDTVEKLYALIGEMLRQMGLFEPIPGNTDKVQQVLSSIIIKKDADLCLITKGAGGFLVPNKEALDKVMEAVEDLKPKLIVFDPIASFWGSEAALNDMAKAVAKFVSAVAERSGACVEMLNHMGKQSSKDTDLTQFAGRGGTGLPSHARISRVMHGVSEERYLELTGEHIDDDKSAILCNINKFTDGTPLYNKPFLIMRQGYLFSKRLLSNVKEREERAKVSDMERVFTFIKETRNNNQYPSRNTVIAYFMSQVVKLSKDRVVHALNLLTFQGHLGERVKSIENPDALEGGKVLIITDENGVEI